MKKTELLEIAKPILFNTEMVKAILEGRKTVTRRVIPEKILDKYYDYDDFCISVMPSDISCTREYEEEFFIKKAKYQVGDILYVRETWQCLNPYSDNEYIYKASCDKDYANDIGNWLPSIHMPKSIARIFLKVTNTKVERLQDITEEQAMNEGISCVYWSPTFNDPDSGGHDADFVEAFEELWNSTIKKKDLGKYGWEENPWVWVIEFEKLEVER